MGAKYVVWIALFVLFDHKSCGVLFLTENELNSTLQISTRDGMVQGKEVVSDIGISYFAYLSIPYAAPPLESLRFRDPQPVSPWQGVLDASKWRSACVELQFKFTGKLFRVNGSEDCLFVNVFTPIRPKSTDNNNLPVIFYIYGGGWMEGSSNVYLPDYMVQQDLIVVTFNYRSGIFGFLSTEDEASRGNYGLKDQHAALKWTNLNIKSFGGDPKKVTIAGHSSGAISVMYHLIHPKSSGLFSGAVALSGGVGIPMNRQKYPRRVAFDIGLSVGIVTDNATELLDRLRGTKLYKLKRAQQLALLITIPEIFENGFPFSPVIESEHENAFLTEQPLALLKNGNFAKVPIFMGTTTNEMITFGKMVPILRPLLLLYEWSPAVFPDVLEVGSPSKRRIVAQEIRKKYTKWNSFVKATDEELIQLNGAELKNAIDTCEARIQIKLEESNKKIIQLEEENSKLRRKIEELTTSMVSDLVFTIPQITTAKILSTHTPVYFFLYNYTTNASKDHLVNIEFPIDTSVSGVGHIEDIIYIWKYDDVKLQEDGIGMKDRILKLLSNFARYRNPTPTVDPAFQNVTWPVLTNTKNFTYIKIEKEFSISQNFRMEFVDFINKLEDDNKC
ncbi:hypothetical protein JTB14_021690 [Gonioctena quinquepunctata]|nr:hypothetical protein JTB14_021690 [Gonioctena quinquepunctata]